jgi:hypothetical protein
MAIFAFGRQTSFWVSLEIHIPDFQLFDSSSANCRNPDLDKKSKATITATMRTESEGTRQDENKEQRSAEDR